MLNRGSAGCAQLPPGPPVNLRARPGDGEVTLTWDRPRNGELRGPSCSRSGCTVAAYGWQLPPSSCSPSSSAAHPLCPTRRRMRDHLRSDGSTPGPQRALLGHGPHPQVNNRPAFQACMPVASAGVAAGLQPGRSRSSPDSFRTPTLCRPQRTYPPLLSSSIPTCSPDYKLSITSLENGQPYRFTVRVSAGIRTARAQLPGWPAAAGPPHPSCKLHIQAAAPCHAAGASQHPMDTAETTRPSLQAFSAAFPSAQNNEASVEATPQEPRPTPSLCTRWVRPEAPTNLRVTPAGRGAVQLCWDQPSGPG